jgi:DNA-binding NarL/FixJ family response regulator
LKQIRLMLVDDHEVVRTGLKTFLDRQEGIQVVAEAGSGSEALEIAASDCMDVVVMDITMPEMDGLEATRRLKELCPQTQVLALTIHEDKQYLFEMMAAGASGYLTKQSAAEDLVVAVHAVADGSIYLQPALARWLLEDYRRLLEQHPLSTAAPGKEQPGGKDLSVLSTRERQVLELVAEGYSNRQIGEQLKISPKTAARHRERIMNKLDMHSSTELVKFAIRTGLIRV